jgi:plastocyanin
MKYCSLISLIILIISISLTACTKNIDYPEQGGNLPSNYIIIESGGSFSPLLLKVTTGSSITFVNNDTRPHNIISNDSISINTNIIAPKSFYFFKNDTLTGVFPYKCMLDSSIRGTIIINP